MRNISDAERLIIADPEGHWQFRFLEVTDFDGAWVNVGYLSIGERNADFLNSYDLDDDIDRNTLTFSASLRGSVGDYSLMPFRTDSPLNVDAGDDYQPLLDLHREWRLWQCIKPRGEFPTGPEEYRERARGIVDRIDISGDRDEIRVQGRGPEADLIDHLIIADEVTPKVYAAGTLATVLQAMLDDQFPATYTLVVEGSAPSTFIDEITYTEPVGFWKLFSDTAAVGTGAVRFKYASDDTLAIHLFTPPRTATVPDWTLGPNEYEKIDNGLDLSTVTNYIVARFVNAAGAIETVTSPATPVSASIARYGLKTAVITLASNIGLNDATRVQAMIDAIRADRELPILGQVIQGTGLWFGELWDYIATPANAVTYDEDQAGGVVGYHEHGENGETTNTFTLAGKPKGRYATWLEISTGGTVEVTPPTVTSSDATYKEEFLGLIHLRWVNVGATVAAAGSVVFDLYDSSTLTTVIDTQAVDVNTDGTAFWAFLGVAAGTIYYVTVTPWSGPLSAGVPTGAAGDFALAQTTAVRKPTDTPTIEWDESDPALLKANVVGFVPGEGEGGIESLSAIVGDILFFAGFGQDGILNAIPASVTEIHQRHRVPWNFKGITKLRVATNVQVPAGGLTTAIAVGWSTTEAGPYTPLDETASITSTGVKTSDWFDPPNNDDATIFLTPMYQGGGGTQTAEVSYVRLQYSNATRVAGGTGGGAVGGCGGAGTVGNTVSDDHFDCGSSIDTTGARFTGANPWSAYGGTASPTADTWNQSSGLLHAFSGSYAGGAAPKVRYQALPAVGVDFRFRCKFTPTLNDGGFPLVGLALIELSTTKILFGGLSSTFVETRGMTGLGGSWTTYSGGTVASAYATTWVEVERIGTTITFRLTDNATDGNDLTTPLASTHDMVSQAQTVDFTTAPDAVGVMINGASQTSDFDWFVRLL